MSRRDVFASLGPGASTHAGLWLERFIPNLGATGASADHIASLASIRVPAGYADFVRRRREGLRGLRPKTILARATVRGRLSIGLGQESVLETSITLQRVWGLPYLPGSALKGLAARAARENLKEPWKPGEEGSPYSVVFGRLEDAGFVTFHDALWIPEGTSLPLDPDVLTVHHPDFYGGKDALPVEWDEPNPVAFLTCKGSYEVALTGPEGWVDKAMEILAQALDHDGLGAKTGTYGHLTIEPERPKIRIPWQPRVQAIQVHTGNSTVEALWQEYEESAERKAIACAILKKLERPKLRRLRGRNDWVDLVFAAAAED